MNYLYLAALAGTDVKSLLITFLVLVLIIVGIGGLYLLIERFWGKFSDTVRMIFGLVMLILLVLWAINQFA